MNFENINFKENQRCGNTPVREENIVEDARENTIASKSYIDLNCDNQSIGGFTNHTIQKNRSSALFYQALER